MITPNLSPKSFAEIKDLKMQPVPELGVTQNSRIIGCGGRDLGRNKQMDRRWHFDAYWKNDTSQLRFRINVYILEIHSW